MIQPIYTSVSNADIVPCGKKGLIIKSDPIPLLRNNYLGEYRTELEKAKVRKNLGIADEMSLQWGNITGHIEDATVLVDYIDRILQYRSELSESIIDVKTALDYALYYVTNFKGEHEAVEDLYRKVDKIYEDINKGLSDLSKSLTIRIDDNALGLANLVGQVTTINGLITDLNNKLSTINVDANILAWVSSKLENSKTITLTEQLEVKISNEEKNSMLLKEDGLYVKDFSEDILNLGHYNTDLSEESKVPSSVGGIKEGTTVAALKGKTINQIIDDILFPTAIPTLIQPRISYTPISKLVKVGSTVLKPSIIFTQGHSGGADGDPIEIILGPDGSEFTGETYPTIGKYTYKAEQKYLEGEELVNNKGELTGIKIEAGTTTTETSTTATYPWYTSSNNKNTPEKEQDLVAFGSSPEIQLSLTGECQIWLPGEKSSIDSFKVDVGMGYLDVDLKNGWTIIVKPYNGIDYIVYSKQVPYLSALPHKIKFTLAL